MKRNEKRNEYRKLYSKYEDLVFYNRIRYSQFLIDFIQNSEADYSDYADEQPEFVDTHVSSMLYQIDNILDIIKDGRDKEVFQEMYNEFELIKKA